jgi:Zn ribbon nucleic-acid-binding protein
MIELIVPIVAVNYEKFCPNCFSNFFEIERSPYGLSFTCVCENCNKRTLEEDLWTKELVNQVMQKIAYDKLEFSKNIEDCYKELNKIKCPKCQEKLNLIKDEDTCTYIINCTKCNYSSNNIETTIQEYNKWKQRAAMMIAIKAKEQQIIEQALESKKEKDTLFRKEDIILTSERDKTVKYLANLTQLDNIGRWNELFVNVKSCNRLEKMLLSQIIELVKEEGICSTYTLENDEDKLLDMFEYIPDEEPIVYDLINRTKIIVVRQILRNLMKYNLLIVSEETNSIIVPKILIDNIEAINNLLISKKINSSIRYVVLQSQNFTCMTCGETGRPLEIAYLKSDKNINNLNNLIALCDSCYDVMTENEILIDGTITVNYDYIDNNELKSYKYVIYHFPDLKDNEYIISKLENLENEYDIDDIIKALTITIDGINKEKIRGNIDSLINYTNGILNKGKSINIYDNLYKKYNLKKWLEDN